MAALTAKGCDGLRFKNVEEQGFLKKKEAERATAAGQKLNCTAWTNHLIDDGENKGLRLVVNSDGSKTWIYRYNDIIDGSKTQIKLGSYPAVALAEARQLLREQRKLRESGVDPREQRAQNKTEIKQAREAKKRKSYTVASLCDSYIIHLKGNRKKWVEPVRMVEKEIKSSPISDILLAELKMPHVQKLHDAIQSRVKNKAHWSSKGGQRLASMVITELRTAIELARRTDNFPDDKRNPCDGVKRQGTGPATARDRHLDEGELEKFFNWIPGANFSNSVRDAILLEILTTARQGEIVQMQWGQIDFKKGVWRQPPEMTKNGKRHRVYLSELASNVLLNRKANQSSDNEFVFYNPYYRPLEPGETRPTKSPRNRPHLSSKTIGAAQWRARQSLELSESFSTHDLRRTALTTLGKLGCPRVVQDKISNHHDGSIAGRYDRGDYEKECRDWLERLALHYIKLGLKVDLIENA